MLFDILFLFNLIEKKNPEVLVTTSNPRLPQTNRP